MQGLHKPSLPCTSVRETAWFVWVALTTLWAPGMVISLRGSHEKFTAYPFSVRETPAALGACEWGTNNEYPLQSSSSFYNYEKKILLLL